MNDILKKVLDEAEGGVVHSRRNYKKYRTLKGEITDLPRFNYWMGKCNAYMDVVLYVKALMKEEEDHDAWYRYEVAGYTKDEII